ncbi:hypothetical protein [Verrucomicrobium sp. BvORR034]|uniref:hypothetical protein n=1 Tax=Verrucomicrobium sp. BvORR034 TaxID=1396418 RepID=UPI002240F3D9|nr:hypothetical protein [Verrucomicrobium sp. BvORR034]
MNTRRSRYWLFWWALVVLICYTVYLSGAANWSPTMKKHTGLGFTDDVTSPVIAMGLADDPGEFHGVLGIPAKQASPSDSSAELGQHSSSQKDIGQDTDSAQKLLRLDFGFLALYTLALLLLIWHLTAAKILQPTAFAVLLASLPLVIAAADVVENVSALSMLGRVEQSLIRAMREVVEAQQDKSDVTARVKDVLANAATRNPDSPPVWQTLHDKKVILLSGDGKDPSAIETIAKLENIPATVYDAVVDAKTADEKVQTLEASGYILIKGDRPTARSEKLQEAFHAQTTPAPATAPATPRTNPQGYIMEQVRQACQDVPLHMRQASLAKWGLSGLFFALLGWVLLKRRKRGPTLAAPRVSWCLSGVLMITGALTLLTGTFIWPICIEAGFLFIIAAFVPLFLGGLKLATSRVL